MEAGECPQKNKVADVIYRQRPCLAPDIEIGSRRPVNLIMPRNNDCICEAVHIRPENYGGGGRPGQRFEIPSRGQAAVGRASGGEPGSISLQASARGRQPFRVRLRLALFCPWGFTRTCRLRVEAGGRFVKEE